MKICIIQILRDRIQSTCVALMGFGEETNYFGGKPTGRADGEVRVGKLKIGKVAGK